MVGRGKIFLFTNSLVLTIMSSIALGAWPNPGSASMPSIQSGLGFLDKILNANFMGYPLFAFAATFMIVYSAVYLVTGKVPLFKESEHRNARMAFAVGIAIYACIGTGLTMWIWGLIYAGTWIAVIVFGLIMLVFLWSIFWQAHGHSRSLVAEGAKLRSEARGQLASLKKDDVEALAVEKQALREKSAVKRLVGGGLFGFGGGKNSVLENLKGQGSGVHHKDKLQTIANEIAQLSHIEGPQAKKLAEGLLKSISALVAMYQSEYGENKTLIQLRQFFDEVDGATAKLTEAKVDALLANAQYVRNYLQANGPNAAPEDIAEAARQAKKAQEVMNHLNTIKHGHTNMDTMRDEMVKLENSRKGVADQIKGKLEDVATYLRTGRTNEALAEMKEIIHLEDRLEMVSKKEYQDLNTFIEGLKKAGITEAEGLEKMYDAAGSVALRVHAETGVAFNPPHP